MYSPIIFIVVFLFFLFKFFFRFFHNMRLNNPAFISEVCSFCSAGSQPKEDSVTKLNIVCSPCASGMYRNADGHNGGYCTACPDLKIAPNQGETSCTSCPSNMICTSDEVVGFFSFSEFVLVLTLLLSSFFFLLSSVKSATEPCEIAVESMAEVVIQFTTISQADTPAKVVKWIRDASDASATAILVASSTSNPENYYKIESATYHRGKISLGSHEVIMLLYFTTTGAAAQIKSKATGAFVINTLKSKLSAEASISSLDIVLFDVQTRDFPTANPKLYQPVFVNENAITDKKLQFTYGQNLIWTSQSTALAYEVSLRMNNDEILTTLCVGATECVTVTCQKNTFRTAVRNKQEKVMSPGICRGLCDVSTTLKQFNDGCDRTQSNITKISLVSDIFFADNPKPSGRWSSVPFVLGQQYKAKVRTIDARGDCQFPVTAPTPNCEREANEFIKIASKPPALSNVTFYRSRGNYKIVQMSGGIHDDFSTNPSPIKFVLQWRSANNANGKIYQRELQERNMRRGVTTTYIDEQMYLERTVTTYMYTLLIDEEKDERLDPTPTVFRLVSFSLSVTSLSHMWNTHTHRPLSLLTYFLLFLTVD